MSQLLEVTEGLTSPIEYDLKNDGAAFDASGMTAGAVLKDKDGNPVAMTSRIEWSAQSTSRIRYKPGSGDLLAAGSPYTLHWKVTDGSGRVAFYPQGQPITVKVYAQ